MPHNSAAKTILFLSTSSGPGGAERVVCNLASSLDQRQFRPIVGLFRPGWLQEQSQRLGVRTCVFPCQGVSQFRWICGLLSFLKQERVDVIHTHEFDANVLGAFAAFVARIPCVSTIHGKHYYWAKARRRIAYRMVSHYATLVAVSHDLKQFIGKKVGVREERIHVVYNGVNRIPLYSRDDVLACKVELGIPMHDKIVGVVGSLYPVKGHSFLLDAVPSILNRLPNTTFVFVGQGELDRELKAQAQKLGVASKVIFLGLREDVHRLLGMIDVFVQPSLSEGLSMAILEAMMAAKPIVATNVGGNRELVIHGQTGFLCESKDSISIGQNLVTLLDDSGLAKSMGDAGRERAVRMFSLETMMESYTSIYVGGAHQLKS